MVAALVVMGIRTKKIPHGVVVAAEVQTMPMAAHHFMVVVVVAVTSRLLVVRLNMVVLVARVQLLPRE